MLGAHPDADAPASIPQVAAPDEPAPPAPAPGEPSGLQSLAERHGALLAGTCVALLAVALCYYQLSRPGLLHGLVEYDDQVFFATAVRLVHGAVPYRDFVIVQPPGLPLLLTPFAALASLVGTRDALGVARLFVPLVVGGEVFLVGVLLRRRGVLAVLVGCGFLALFANSILTARTTMQEPVVDLLCLAGLALLLKGEELAPPARVMWAGVAFGFAGAVKLWAIAPAVAAAIVCFPDWRRVWRFALGALGGFAVPVLPFLVLAPSRFVHDVLLDQTTRALAAQAALPAPRFVQMLGLYPWLPFHRQGYVIGAASAHGIEVAVAAVVIVAYALPRPRRTRLDFAVLLGAVATVGLLLAPSEFYYHYAAFPAPFVGLLLGVSAGRLAACLGSFVRSRGARLAAGAVAAALVVAVVALALPSRLDAIGSERTGVLGVAVDRLVPAGTCAVSDQVGVLVDSNRLTSSDTACPDFVDSFGTALSLDGGNPLGTAPASAALKQYWLQAVTRADYVLLTASASARAPVDDPALVSYLDRHFHTTFVEADPQTGRVTVYIRNTQP